MVQSKQIMKWLDSNNKDWYQIKLWPSLLIICKYQTCLVYQILAFTDDYNWDFIVLLW